MASVPNIEVVLEVKYKILFIPFATFTRVGEIELLTILGIHVYERVGDVCGVFGFCWKKSKV